MFVLDTNVVSELRRRRPHGAVLIWLRSIPDDQLFISAVTIGEIQSGAEATRTSDPAKAVEIEQWLDVQISTFTVLPMDAAVFRMWAKLMQRTSDDHLLDGMIAATALVHGAKIATRNVGDFRHFGVEIINPFETSR